MEESVKEYVEESVKEYVEESVKETVKEYVFLRSIGSVGRYCAIEGLFDPLPQSNGPAKIAIGPALDGQVHEYA